MKIFDMHIHGNDYAPNPEELLKKLEDAGVWGCCVFSNRPDYDVPEEGTSFDERLTEVLNWSKGYEDRIIPVVWINPYEENIIENIRKAVDMGVCGFKMIPTTYYVYEEKVMEVLQEIANLNKPVIFHSGILYNCDSASKYNRPLNWEELLNVEGLKFALSHCSWPWTDECYALYGEFMYNTNNGSTTEMFLDITPGAPNSYRKEMFRKYFTTGYDVGSNMMYGSDATAGGYSTYFVRSTVDNDLKIFDELGVSKEIRENIYFNNAMRFFGKSTVEVKTVRPIDDAMPEWTCENKEVYKIIEDYYKKLSFPKLFDNEFYNSLGKIKISDAITIKEYDKKCEDGKRNLYSYLYMCDALKKRYDEKGIPEEIFWDTIHDLVIWTSTWSDIKGGLYLGELFWLACHMDMQLFKLGRLQFKAGKCEHDIPEKGLKKGDNIMEVHIPEGGSFTPEECRKSIEYAKEFFAKYFPEYKFEHFTCHSWLMDKVLEEMLPKESKIIQFQNMFDVYHPEEDDAILRYVFKWNTTRYTVKNAVAESSFAKKVKEYVRKDRKFYVSYGVLKNS